MITQPALKILVAILWYIGLRAITAINGNSDLDVAEYKVFVHLMRLLCATLGISFSDCLTLLDEVKK